MQLQNFYAQDVNGNIVPGAICSLFLPGTTTLATGLIDVNGSPLANPFAANSNGLVQFAAPNGAYDLRIEAGLIVSTLPIVFADTLQALVQLGGFLPPSATPPTTRVDGTPLQIGDRYMKTPEDIEYIYKTGGWEPNNLDGQLIASPQGSGYVGFSDSIPYPSNTVGQVLKDLLQGFNQLYDKAIISPLDFGAAGDGNAIIAAIEHIRLIGGGTLDIPGGMSWSFPGLLTIDNLPSNLWLKGSPGTTFDFSSRTGGYEALYKALITARGTISAPTAVTIDLLKGDIVININTAGFSEQDLILITSNKTDPGDTSPVQVGEYAYIDEIISPTQMRINNSLFGGYAIADSARVYKFTPVENITVSDIIFKGQGRLDPLAGDLGLVFIYGRNIRVRDCAFRYIDMYQLEFRSCYGFWAKDCTFHNTKYTTSGQTPGTNRPNVLVPRGPVQYQVRVADACQYGWILNCRGEGSRHFFNTGHSYRADDGNPAPQVGYLFGLSRFVHVVDCHAKNTWHACYSTHNDSEFIYFERCVGENSGHAGFNPRHRNITLKDCTARYCNIGYRLTERVTDLMMDGCRALNCGVDIQNNESIQDAGGTITLKNCSFEDSGSGASFVPPAGNAGKLVVKNCEWTRCVPVAVGNARPLRIEGRWDSVVVSGVTVDGTAGASCIHVAATTPIAIINGCVVMNALRPISMTAPVVRGILANNIQYNMTVNPAFTNTSTTPTLQNNI